ncbi:MAG TPA: PHP domain-containing protein, partial [Gemmatimonadales bacterium]|nr:PHP domain-containing protein [Gemmatimonadales bacterium]
MKHHFVHLHVHSWYSFGVGASSPEQLARAAARRGMNALALTDLNNVTGAIIFQQACDAAGIRPILGATLRARGQRAVVLARDEQGWGALCRAITAINWRQRVPLAELLATDRDGLAVLSDDVALLEQVATHSGTTDLYAALVPGQERHRVLAAARRLGIAPVATGAVVMADADAWSRHRLIQAIHRNGTLNDVTVDDELHPAPSPPQAWLRPAAEMIRHYPDVPEAVSATLQLAEGCRYRIPMGRTIAPRAEAANALERLRQLAYDGALRRYGTIAPVTRERLEHELGIIALKRFADYFLVVHEIVQHGPTHCGRGSVANSIVSYALGITHVEPLGAGLLFERFLNPARSDPPDIDLDFPWDERDR